MKPLYSKTNFSIYTMALLAIATLTSCGTMQTVNNNDGIYDDTQETPQPKVVIANQKEYKEYEENYFTNELKRLDQINGTDIITDIEDYNSGNYITEDNLTNDQETNNEYYEPWGSNNTDVIVNIDRGFGYGWNNWGWNNGWGWNRPWGFRGGFGYGWNNWGWNNWGWNNWGWDPLWHPYHTPFYWNRWNRGFYGGWAFNNPYRWGWFGYNNRFGFRNNRYFRNGRNANVYRNNRLAYSSGRYGNTNRVYSRNSQTSNRRATTQSSSRSSSANRSYRNGSSNSSSRSYNNRSNSSQSRASRSRSYSSNRSSSRGYSSGRSSSSRGSYSGGGRSGGGRGGRR